MFISTHYLAFADSISTRSFWMTCVSSLRRLYSMST